MDSISYEEFLRLYTQSQRQIWRFIHTILPHDQDADDVLQETSLVLWSKRDSYQRDKDFRNWAFGIARLQALKYLRQKKSRQLLLSESVINDIADAAHKHLLANDSLHRRQDAIDKCLQLLDEAQRRTIEDRYLRSLPTKTIADNAGVAVQTIYSQLAKARQRLCDCVRRRLASAEY